MKNLAKRLLDATLVPFLAYLYRRIPREAGPALTIAPHGVLAETQHRAVADAADYADAHMAAALCLSEMPRFWTHAFGRRRRDGLIIEFGVWQGRSINYFAALTGERIYGFDSFEGLREDWKGWSFAKGHFSLGGVLPAVADNVTLVKGWVDQTLLGFLADHPEPFAFIHIDTDTYEAARSILDLAGDRFRPGTVVVFDEYFGFRGWRLGEFKAWQEFVAARGLAYEYLAFSDYSVSLVVS